MGAAVAQRVEVSARPETTHALGRVLAAAVQPLPSGGLVVTLHGDLGAGKTIFVKGVAEGLGVASHLAVVSPTFTIARSYPAADGVFLHHVDAYRLRGPEDLELAGFEDLRGEGCVTCVEWGERVLDALPDDRIEVHIEICEAEVQLTPDRVPVGPRRLRFVAGGPSAAGAIRRLGSLREGPEE